MKANKKTNTNVQEKKKSKKYQKMLSAKKLEFD